MIVWAVIITIIWRTLCFSVIEHGQQGYCFYDPLIKWIGLYKQPSIDGIGGLSVRCTHGLQTVIGYLLFYGFAYVLPFIITCLVVSFLQKRGNAKA
ncbi:MAG: hypothetical protein JWM56_672 [Candidatus Peribacteria bacterium]|nr:hypothetical protein [Candidatus Peribacteria bacterium]